MKNMIFGVVGHVAHGKTSLVRELTGLNTDSSPLEKTHGISMDIGLAHLDLSDRNVLDLVDLPGHERFVRSMIRGSSGINGAILVVAANEGIMPQTEEHLAILQLLGVEFGFCVITKVDLVDGPTEDRVKLELARLIEGTFLESAPMVGFSAATGAGREEIVTHLRDLADGRETETANIVFRLPIDKVYVASGRGVVVAGTVIGGALESGEEVVIYPAGLKAKARSLQVHREAKLVVAPGGRAGINVAGIKGQLIRRGDTVARPGALIASKTVNARLRVLASSERGVVSRERVKVNIGADEVVAQIVPLCGDALEPGDECYVQLRCEDELAVLPRDRFIIRPLGGGRILGGGTILQVATGRRGIFGADLIDRLEKLANGSEVEVVADALWSLGRRLCRADELVSRSGYAPERIEEVLSLLVAAGRALLIVDAYISTDRFQEFCRLAERVLRVECEKFPLRRRFRLAEVKSKIATEIDRALFLSILDDLKSIGLIEIAEDHVVVVGVEVELSLEQVEFVKGIRSLCRSHGAPVRAGTLKELCGEDADIEPVLGYLAELGELVLFKDLSFMSARSYAEMLDTLRRAMAGGRALTLAEIRDLLEIGRNPLQVVLEHLDDVGFTRRVGDARVLVELTRQPVL